MPGRVLVTGGAGFIGSHVCDELLAAGYSCRVFDCEDGSRARGSEPDVEHVRGDIRDGSTLRAALDGVDAVVHLAGLVGVGPSIYRISDYVSVNDLGTAQLLEALIERPVERLVVASSMAVYGEGSYRDRDGRPRFEVHRDARALRRREWEPTGDDGEPLAPAPISEDQPPSVSSIYGLCKLVQEQACRLVGRSYGVPVTALRLFNVYGPRQRTHPTSGAIALFGHRSLQGKAPRIFEDGEQTRDFIHVRDAARAFRLALETPRAIDQVINVGSGVPRSLLAVAAEVEGVIGDDAPEPELTFEHRPGDVRHGCADLSRARELLGFAPAIPFADGVAEVVAWTAAQQPISWPQSRAML